MVQQLASEEEFNAAISDKNFKATIVDFTATWCGPCQMIKVNKKLLNFRINHALERLFFSKIVKKNLTNFNLKKSFKFIIY
jgi:thiol-disulfide isomerase/thioredoxin